MGEVVRAPVVQPERRPRRRITRLIHEALDRQYLEEVGVSMAEAIARKVVDMAASGDLDAMKFITDRVEGRAVQALELTGPDGAPLERITGETNAVDASRIYAQLLTADRESFLVEEIAEADNVIELAARRAEKEAE